jgi:hypothetical protein
MRNTLSEVVISRQVQVSETRQKFRLVTAYIAAVVMVVALLGLPLLRRQWIEAQSAIACNVVPLPGLDVHTQLAADASAQAEDSDDDTNNPTGQLADADLPRLGEAGRLGPDGTLVPRHIPHTRVGADTEQGMPLPIETRESKPVY